MEHADECRTGKRVRAPDQRIVNTIML